MAQSRIEALLAALVNGETSDIVPQSRNEAYLKALVEKMSGPSEVVILPETELTVANIDEEGGVYYLHTPLVNVPTDGGICEIMWGGEKYNSPALDASDAMGAPAGTVFVLGNADQMGITEVIGGNPAPDLPFVLMLIPNGQPMEQDGPLVYVNMASLGITPEPPVLSIVQTEGATSGGDAAESPVLVVNAQMTSVSTVSSVDKSFDQVAAAVKAGKIVYLRAMLGDDYMFAPIATFNTDENGVMSALFSLSISGAKVDLTYTASGMTGKLS